MNKSLIESSLKLVFEQYIEAFSIKDFAAVTKNYAIPALLVSPGEPLFIGSNEMLTGLMQKLRGALPAEYSHTTLVNIELYQFSEKSAAAHITYDRCTNDNTPLSTEKGVYYFCKDAEQWKIFSVVLIPEPSN
jgi:hypothetical protein